MVSLTLLDGRSATLLHPVSPSAPNCHTQQSAVTLSIGKLYVLALKLQLCCTTVTHQIYLFVLHVTSWYTAIVIQTRSVAAGASMITLNLSPSDLSRVLNPRRLKHYCRKQLILMQLLRKLTWYATGMQTTYVFKSNVYTMLSDVVLRELHDSASIHQPFRMYHKSF